MVHILLIDDHPLVTDGIKTMLATQEGIVVSAAAKTAKEALNLLEQSTFEIILLDLSLPDMDGLVLCSEIRKTTKVPKSLP
jgi:DNA-binding NarL/FixJ family response regulator